MSRMDITEFVEQFGVSAEVTHLKDFATHTPPNKAGMVEDTVGRQWVIVYEHPDAVRGDQRLLVVPHQTGVHVSSLDAVEVLRDLVAQATQGTAAFEEFLLRNFQPVHGPHNMIKVNAWAHPLELYGAWHVAAGLYHQLRHWCSSAAMRDALDMIDLDNPL